MIDEAYHEFVTGADVPDAIELFGDRPNVAVLRTLSKAYGLAGLRIGFMVADPDVVDAVNASSLPFAVNGPAQAAALAALEQGDEVDPSLRRADAASARGSPRSCAGAGSACRTARPTSGGSPAGTQSATLGARARAARRGHPAARRRASASASARPTRTTCSSHALADVADDIDLAADWDGATGDAAAKAAGWLDRLDAAHGTVPRPPPPRPPRAHRAGAGRGRDVGRRTGVGARRRVRRLLARPARQRSSREPATDDPVPFGRTRRDAGRIAAIEAGRNDDPAAHLATVERSADRLAALLAGMTNEDWSRTGKHETLGVMDLDAQLDHFHVGHYEEHADQLDELIRRSRHGAPRST